MTIESYALAPGTRIGNYLIQQVLGRGFESEVYSAEECGTNAERVLKIFPITDEITAAYVVTKARAFAALSETQATPHFFGCGEVTLRERPSMYHVYARVHGITLRQFIAQNAAQLSPREAFKLLSAIAERIDRIHAKGYAIADFESCENILIADGTPVFIDFYSGLPNQPNTYYQNEVNEFEKVARIAFQLHSDSRELHGILNAIRGFRQHAQGKDLPFSLREWLVLP